MSNQSFTVHLGMALLVGLPLLTTSGCVNRRLEKMNEREQSVYKEYQGEKYEDDLVSVEGEEVDDQGDSVAPATLAAIQDTITNVYERDFGRCLQKDMDAFENRWIAGTFSVEFTITTEGKVTSAEVLEMDIKEQKTDKGKKARKAEIFPGCVEESVYRWEFDPPPEVEYTHTYTGKVGEAF